MNTTGSVDNFESNLDSSVVAGFFQNSDQAEHAIGELSGAGFAQIGVASRDSKGARKLAERVQARPGVATSPGESGRLEETEGEAEFAEKGDLQSVLVAANVPESEARYFDGRVKKDKGVLVTVRVPAEREAEARECLEQAGGDIGADAVAEETEVETAELPPVPTSTDESGETIQLHGELLKVHRDRVPRGEVRIRKEVVTEPESVTVPVTHEEAVIEHVAADATSGPAESPSADGPEIRVPLTEERVRVEREPTVTEQLHVGKRDVESEETLHADLKREKLKLGKAGEVTEEELAKLKRDRAA